MLTSRGASPLNAYQQVGAESEVMSASPHRLIQLLLQRAIDKIASARGAMSRNDPSTLGNSLSIAIAILDTLRASLDKEAGRDIAENLDMLYEYMTLRLAEANMKQDESMLEEVSNLLHEIKAGWDGIEEEAKRIQGGAKP